MIRSRSPYGLRDFFMEGVSGLKGVGFGLRPKETIYTKVIGKIRNLKIEMRNKLKNPAASCGECARCFGSNIKFPNDKNRQVYCLGHLNRSSDR